MLNKYFRFIFNINLNVCKKNYTNAFQVVYGSKDGDKN
jgi:hypothetical protein